MDHLQKYCKENGIFSPQKIRPFTFKLNLSLNKRMLLISWNIGAPKHYEVLKPGERLNSERYCQQLDNMNTSLPEKGPAMLKRKDIILLHDNDTLYVALVTRRKLIELGWKIPPYSLDAPPSDYYLFLSLQNFLLGK